MDKENTKTHLTEEEIIKRSKVVYGSNNIVDCLIESMKRSYENTINT